MTLVELQQAFDEAKAKYHTDKTNKKAKKAFKKAKKALAAAKEANNGTETNSKKRSLDVSEETPKKKAKTGPSLADLKKANKEAKAAWKASDGDKKLKKIWKKAKAALAEAKAQQGEQPEVQEKEEKVEVKVDVDALKAAVKAARKIFKKDKSNKEAKKALKAAKKVLAEAVANASNNEKETIVENEKETAADEGSMDLLASLKKNKPVDETESVLSGLKKGGGGGFAAKGGAKGAKGNNPPSRRLFIGNLSFSIDDEKCKEYFKDCGEIVDLHWLEHRDTGKFKGCGFISFGTQEEADKAMAKNGQEFMGRPITIDYDKERAPRKKHDQGEPKAPSKRLFLGNISDDADDSLITEFFKECGPLLDIHWVTDRDSGEFRGFGFVTFGTQEEATKAYEMTGSNFLGKRIRIDYTLPRPARGSQRGSRPLSEKLPGCTSIFIGNLSDEIDDDKIREFFKDAGEISQIRWLKDRETGEFKCAGFVEFENPEASLDLAVKRNGEEILGKSIRIDYAKPRQPRP